MQHRVEVATYATESLARGHYLEVTALPRSTVNVRRLALPGAPAAQRFHRHGLIETTTVTTGSEPSVQRLGPFQTERHYAIEVLAGSSFGADYEVSLADVAFA